MLALQGPSGSGKSTLLLLAAAALRADAGIVSYEGRDLAGLGERESAQYRLADVGLISQNTHLMARVRAVGERRHEAAARRRRASARARAGRSPGSSASGSASAPRARRRSSPAASASAWRSRARSRASRG